MLLLLYIISAMDWKWLLCTSVVATTHVSTTTMLIGLPVCLLKDPNPSSVLLLTFTWLERRRFVLGHLIRIKQPLLIKMYFQVQQVLGKRSGLERFIKNSADVDRIQEMFTGLYSLDQVKFIIILLISFLKGNYR